MLKKMLIFAVLVWTSSLCNVDNMLLRCYTVVVLWHTVMV